MPLTQIKAGYVVKCNVKGRQFTATVDEKIDGGLKITPHDKGVSYYHVTARQVTQIVSKENH